MRAGVKLLGCASAGSVALVLLLSSSVRGQSEMDSEGHDLPSMPTSEPATEPLGSAHRWEANAPYEHGPGATDYDHLAAADKAIADEIKGEANERGAVLAVYAASAQQDFDKQTTELAQHRLGLEQLDQIGVVDGENGEGADGTPGHGASGLGHNGGAQ